MRQFKNEQKVFHNNQLLSIVYTLISNKWVSRFINYVSNKWGIKKFTDSLKQNTHNFA